MKPAIIFLFFFLIALPFLSSDNQTNSSCISDWKCGSWSNCINGNQTRLCEDLNSCEINKIETTKCGCTPVWNCTEWSECLENTQIRVCIDSKACGNLSEKPIETKECGENCIPNWKCEIWLPEKCPDSKFQTRECRDLNKCGTLENKPEQARTCSKDFSWLITFITAALIILILGNIGILKDKIKKIKSQNSENNQQHDH